MLQIIKKIFSFIKEFFSSIMVHDQRKNDEAYLAEATDIYDLEFRMRKLDENRSRYSARNYF